jgi:hypothetical protein
MKITCISLLLVFCLFSCSKSDMAITPGEIAFGQCQTFDAAGLKLCFVSLNEYRCPCNADCFWEGSADAGIRVTSQNGIDTTVILTELPQLDKFTAVIDGHTIKLDSVEVTDFCKDYGVSSKYKIKVMVE